jgi:predicted MFS family arabinose efflux permease
MAMAAAIGIGRFVYTPILPIMLDSLGWSKADAGLVASANFLGYLIGAVASAGQIAAAWQRNWLLAALLASAFSTAGMAFDQHFTTHLVLRLIGGAASAYVNVLASTLVLARLAALKRGDLTAVHFAGVGAGIMASAAVVSMMTSLGADWQALWLAAGAMALGATALVATLIPEQVDSATPPAAANAEVRARGLPALVVAYGLFGFGYVITATFLVAIVRAMPELKALEAWIWVLFGFAAVPSVALWSWVGTRIGLAAAFAVACLVEGVGVAASVEWTTLPGVSLSAVMLGGTFMGLTALGLMMARQLSGSASQRAIGLMTASFAAGQMIGPTVAGFLFDRLGDLRVPSLLAAAALTVAAALAIFAGRASQPAGYRRLMSATWSGVSGRTRCPCSSR